MATPETAAVTHDVPRVHTKVSQGSSELRFTFTPRLTKPGSKPVADGTVRDVEGRSSEFVLAETGGSSLKLLRAKLATSFAVSVSGPSRPARARRIWLDTFDWRLYKAGLTLYQVTAGGRSQLILTGPDGEPVTAPVDRLATLRWPAPATRLPAGALRDRVGAVTGNRALLPVVTAASQASDLRLLNGDEKTIARVSIDALTVSRPAARTHDAPGTTHSTQGAQSAHGVLPTRLTIHEVRGYPSAARRARRLLAGTDGVSVTRQTALDAALAANGRHALDYTGKVDVKLRARMPGRAAVRLILLQQLDTLEANADGVLHDIDTEFLHDLRIAVRRTRSALKLLGDVLPGDLTLRFASEFRWLGDLTTPVRDLDVQLEELPSMAAGLVAAGPADLEPFRVYLIRRRAAERRALNRGLRSDRFATVLGEWRKALTVPRAGRRRPAGPRAADLAADRTGRAYDKVIKVGAAITDDSPAESLHTLRKRCKELRYVLEFFASLHDPAAQRAMVGDLKRLQDCLGEFQDCEVQQHEILALAAAMLSQQAAPASTLLAMGEIAGQLGRRQRQARTEFASRFTALAGSAGRQRLAALVPDPAATPSPAATPEPAATSERTRPRTRS
jgi:CHAD domain-containing protein